MNKLAPVLLFTYKRLDELKQTVAHLQSSLLSEDTTLYLFSDGPKSKDDIEKINENRRFLKDINGFKKIVYRFSPINKGLASSIIDGVTEVLREYENAIILEDDLLVSKNFLHYMNKTLDYYKNHENVISVCGYSHTVSHKTSENYPYDVYFTKRSSSWGWATWRNKWEGIDWEVNDFSEFSRNKKEVRKFNEWGSDLYSMLQRQQKGIVNSWAIRYSYHQFKHNMWSVFPVVSKIKNIGFKDNATNTKDKFNRFKVQLDKSLEIDFKYMKNISLNDSITAEFKSINSIRNRLKYKLLNLWPF